MKIFAKLLVIIALGLCFSSSFAQVLTMNDSSVINSSPKRVGANIGAIEYYDNGNILKNIIGTINPGFEPPQSAQIQIMAANGTTTSFTDYNQYDVVETNYWQGGTITVVTSQSGGALGCSSTITSNTGRNHAWISSISVTSGTATIIGTNSYQAGDLVNIYGTTLSFTNPVTIATVTGSSFTVTGTGLPNTSATIERNAFSQNNASYAPTFTLSSACSGAIQTGDIIRISKTFSSTPEYYLESSQGGFWAGGITSSNTITANTTDLCATCGNQSIAVTTGGSGTVIVQEYFDNNTDNVWRLISGTHHVTFWAKSASGSPTLSVVASRSSTNGFSCSMGSVSLTSTWTQYSLACNGTEIGISSNNPSCVAGGVTTACTAPGLANVQWSFGGTGVTYLDNVSFTKDGQTNPTVFTDNAIVALQNLHLDNLRYWVNQNAETMSNWTAAYTSRKPTTPTFMVGPAGSGSVVLGLYDYLAICEYLNTEPYLEIPVTFTDSDSQALVEFLSAPSTSSPWGTQRASLGHATPYTTTFPNLLATFCNECWNGGSFAYQSLPSRSGTPGSEYYYDYSSRTRDVYAAMRSDAYWPSNVSLGFDVQTGVSYTGDLGVTRAKPDFIEMNGYMLPYVTDTSSNVATWGSYIANLWTRYSGPSNVDYSGAYNSTQLYSTMTTCGANGATACTLSEYEWGQGTWGGTPVISQSAQDYLDAGAGTGIVDMVSPLLSQQLYPNSFKTQSIFAFDEWSNQCLTSNTCKLWGTIIDVDGATHNVRPSYLAVQMVNNAVIGSMFSCTLDSSNLYTFAGNTGNGDQVPPGVASTSNLPYVFSFCFKSGLNRSILLINTDTASSHTINFIGTNLPQGTVTETQYFPSSPNALNESNTGTATYLTAASVSLNTTTVSSPSSVVIPAFSSVRLDYAVIPPPATPTVFSLTIGGSIAIK